MITQSTELQRLYLARGNREAAYYLGKLINSLEMSVFHADIADEIKTLTAKHKRILRSAQRRVERAEDAVNNMIRGVK